MSTNRGRKPLLRLTSNTKVSSNLSKGRFVTIDGAYPLTEGTIAIGIVGEDTPSGDYASITVSGIEFIELQATITKGSLLTTGSDGKAKPKGATDYSMGIALDDGDNGDTIRIKLS